jgi:hypothetical protein
MEMLLVKINMIEILVKKNNLDLCAKFNSVVIQQAHYVHTVRSALMQNFNCICFCKLSMIHVMYVTHCLRYHVLRILFPEHDYIYNYKMLEQIAPRTQLHDLHTHQNF